MDPWILFAIVATVVIGTFIRLYIRESRRLENRTPEELEQDRMKVRHEVFAEWLKQPAEMERFLRRMPVERSEDWRLKFRRYVIWRSLGHDHTRAFLAAEHPVVDDASLFGEEKVPGAPD